MNCLLLFVVVLLVFVVLLCDVLPVFGSAAPWSVSDEWRMGRLEGREAGIP